MMIERAGVEILEAIAAALDMALPSVTSLWVERAGREGVPLIVGWDLRGGGERRCLKVYVNASDAAHAVRERLCAALLPEVQSSDLPAVLGMNVCADGRVETKVYIQAADAGQLASGLTGRARQVTAAASAEGAVAGGVLSFDVRGRGLEPRAFFVALRDPIEGRPWRCVEDLPGYDAEAIGALLPFAPAPPRSVGVSLQDESWTVYCKPLDSSRAPEALEPTAIFRANSVEVGIFVEPSERAARAFCRTERHAISVRERQGTAEPQAIESLMRWFASCVRTAERDGVSVVARLGDPPSPWNMVAGGQP
jgi:hypothetical protein